MNRIIDTFRPTRDFLVCIDSDGTVFDNMELKHKECFCPATVNVWGLQGVSRYAREEAERVNLYSASRGTNRFAALVETLERTAARPEVKTRGYRLPELEPLRQWIREAPVLNVKALRDYAAERERIRRDPAGPAKHQIDDVDDVLRRAVEWSDEVDENIRRIVHDVPPLPGVREALRELRCFADVVIVSGTPEETLRREWIQSQLDEYVCAIAGQEQGTKAECIAKAMQGYYDRKKVLKIGDAPGDLTAARKNQVLFCPVMPGAEEESWRRIREVDAGAFREGTYETERMEPLIRQFLGRLSSHG